MDAIKFSDATYEQIERILNAHYNGEIDIADYWHVGDTRKIHINSIPASSNNNKSHVAQDMTFVILDFNHDDLVNQIGTKNKAAVTIQCREILGNKGTAEYDYCLGKSSGSATWSTNPMRTWMNDEFIKALPETIQPLIKTVKTISSHPSNGTVTQNKAFWLSLMEIRGNAVGFSEGTQYKYYETTNNRTKYVNNNGSPSSTKCYYWSRTYASISTKASMYLINTSNDSEIVSTDFTGGNAPAFCL